MKRNCERVVTYTNQPTGCDLHQQEGLIMRVRKQDRGVDDVMGDTMTFQLDKLEQGQDN